MPAAILLAGAAGVPAWAQPPGTPAAAQAGAKHADAKKDKSIKAEKAPATAAPDADLLDYLGSYGDAAEGLDPLGLADAEGAVAPAPAPPAKDRQ
jgi:hypothetical protein